MSILNSVQNAVKTMINKDTKYTAYINFKTSLLMERQSGKGLQFNKGLSSIQGRRANNEDAHVIDKINLDGSSMTIAAIFDGHGGQEVAQFCEHNFKSILTQALQENKDVKDALKQTFEQLDKQACDEHKSSGCTATCIVVKGDTIYTANAGDARSVYSFNGKVKALTEDHKPSSQNEQERLKKLGNPAVKVNDVFRLGGQIAVSRAIGDKDLKSMDECKGLISDPDTEQYDCSQGTIDYIILACDGLFDVLSNEELHTAVMTALDKDSGFKGERHDIIRQAMQRYIIFNETRAGDELLLELENKTIDDYDSNKCANPQNVNNICQKIAIALTRMAYMLQSTDNISCIVMIPE